MNRNSLSASSPQSRPPGRGSIPERKTLGSSDLYLNPDIRPNSKLRPIYTDYHPNACPDQDLHTLERQLSPEQHAALKQDFAIPTPLPSPSRLRQRHKGDVPSKELSNGGCDGTLEEGIGREGKMLTWRERIRHFTWTWFTMTMATGQLANVLYTGMCNMHALDLPGGSRTVADMC